MEPHLAELRSTKMSGSVCEVTFEFELLKWTLIFTYKVIYTLHLNFLPLHGSF